MLASSFRQKPESTRWMPANAGMTNTPQLVAEMFIVIPNKVSNLVLIIEGNNKISLRLRRIEMTMIRYF
jgi:hypothetical protein